ISAEPGETGSRQIDNAEGLRARTEFQVVARLGDGTTLVEAYPITGRTNHIRLHLATMGVPICGDPMYKGASTLGATQTLTPQDAPLCLHASRIEFTHPLTRERMQFNAPAPQWAK